MKLNPTNSQWELGDNDLSSSEKAGVYLYLSISEQKELGEWSIVYGQGEAWIFHYHYDKYHVCGIGSNKIINYYCRSCSKMVPDSIMMILKLQEWNAKEKNET